MGGSTFKAALKKNVAATTGVSENTIGVTTKVPSVTDYSSINKSTAAPVNGTKDKWKEAAAAYMSDDELSLSHKTFVNNLSLIVTILNCIAFVLA